MMYPQFVSTELSSISMGRRKPLNIRLDERVLARLEKVRHTMPEKENRTEFIENAIYDRILKYEEDGYQAIRRK